MVKPRIIISDHAIFILNQIETIHSIYAILNSTHIMCHYIKNPCLSFNFFKRKDVLIQNWTYILILDGILDDRK